jgi:UDP-N-acetylmuramyl pentapeptide synthase
MDEIRANLRWNPALLRIFSPLAAGYRKLRRGAVFVGVTGSGGKTTSVALTTAVLAARDGGTPPRSLSARPRGNTLPAVVRRILTMRPGDRFLVMEVAASAPGSVAESARILRPDIAVITNVGSDHFKAFRTLDAIADEKQSLLADLSPGGTAVLNVDDPHVKAMTDAFAGRVITFGLAPGATVRAADIRGAWPQRLSFVASHQGESVAVATQLVGKHWVTSVLGALAVGVARGVSLADGAQAVAAVEPVAGRMSPVELGDGVTFIRDDCKAPLWSFPLALDFLREAEAERKVLVIGTISDYAGAVGRKYRRVARQALEVADQVCFVGHNAHLALKERSGPRGHALSAFATVKDAAEEINPGLRPGDLVLLKGSNRADHLVRILLARTSQVGCWRHACHRTVSCERCRLLGVPASG